MRFIMGREVGNYGNAPVVIQVSLSISSELEKNVEAGSSVKMQDLLVGITMESSPTQIMPTISRFLAKFQQADPAALTITTTWNSSTRAQLYVTNFTPLLLMQHFTEYSLLITEY